MVENEQNKIPVLLFVKFLLYIIFGSEIAEKLTQRANQE